MNDMLSWLLALTLFLLGSYYVANETGKSIEGLWLDIANQIEEALE
jgi:hypothetical protein